ncbi:GtrA family protein [Acetobacteraceae bacterium KSS8]|uniref:GtrA family protein n=1 Tax=Endosaccharibacter trunci TaxID=2812733 RepID=A0ABT1W8C7_9PROT|nr:GtrA family protein [Acetobacteraceae bacterium KSS8]
MTSASIDLLPADPLLPDAGEPAADPVIAAIASRHGRWLKLATQFLRFGTVGGLGFLWDAATVYALKPFVGLTIAALGAYLVAATMNWMLNRLWTFRGSAQKDGLLRQWLTFLGANLFGFSINRGVMFSLVWASPICAAYPVLPLAAGSLAGMFANFGLSRRVVFRDAA